MANARALSITLVTETFAPEINGVAMTLGHLANGLRARGHQLMIVRPRQKHEHTGRHSAGQWLVPGLPLPGYGELRFGLPITRQLWQHWRKTPPDVVHIATEGPLGLSALAAARALAIPVTSTFHTNFHAYSLHYGVGLLQGSIERYLRWFHNRTAATLVPTSSIADDLQRKGFQNVGIISRGVDVLLFNPQRRCRTLRAEWGAGDDDLVVMVVSRIAAEKNLPLAIRAFTAIRACRPDALMILVGDGPQRQALSRTHPECRFVGVRQGEELARHYASADLFLFPSLTETFGNVVSEALASGLPMVAFDCAAAGSLIDNGINGQKVSPGNEAAFIAAAIELAGQPEQLLAMRNRCAASVEHLDWEKIHERFAGVIQAVAAQSAPTISLRNSLARSRRS